MAAPRLSTADAHTAMAAAIQRFTGLRSTEHAYSGWLGIEMPDVRAAIWMMRALVVTNVLARREDVVLYVPVHPALDPDGELIARRVTSVWRLAHARSLLA